MVFYSDTFHVLYQAIELAKSYYTMSTYKDFQDFHLSDDNFQILMNVRLNRQFLLKRQTRFFPVTFDDCYQCFSVFLG